MPPGSLPGRARLLVIAFLLAGCGGGGGGEPECTPDCSGKDCGDDGCGGQCGTCGDGRVCEQGVCVCTSRASTGCHQDDVWWFDSCGVPEEIQSVCEHGCEAGACLDCTPDCAGLDCGPDGCGGSCGSCDGGAVCQEGLCVCTSHAYTGCHQDDVWWFDSCGQAEEMHTVCDAGCEDGACTGCEPDCGERECGPDPVCGESCGECAEDHVCEDGVCTPVVQDCREHGCPDGHQCDLETGVCFFVCLVDVDCDDGLDCTQETCTPDFYCETTLVSDCPWPAEQTLDAENLTAIEGPAWDNDFYRDLSGAVWNPVTRMLWVCRNNGPSKVWAVSDDGGGFEIAEKNGERGEWSDFGDLEGLTLVDYDEPESLFLLIEGGGRIQEYDFSSYGTSVLVNDWDAGPILGGDGAEGITFVPDEFLAAQGFVDPGGAPALSSQGMGGLMFVGHQGGGTIYVFDLNRQDGTYLYLGRFVTDRDETAGLEFDRSTGLLYILHGAGHNVLEVSALTSTDAGGGERKLDTLMVYTGPDNVPLFSDNYEGIALASDDECADGHRSFFLTIDGGKLYSLIHFREFPCGQP